MGLTRRLVKGSRITATEFDANHDFFGGGITPTLVTISGGILTLNGTGLYRVETEGAAALDTLDRILNTLDSDWIYLRLANNARQVILTHGTWLKLEDQQPLLLANTFSCIYFRNHGGGVHVEERRSIHL